MASGGDFEEKKLLAYFAHLASALGKIPDTKTVCVAHMVSNSRVFLPALEDVAPVGLLLPKPQTADSADARAIYKLGFQRADLSREWASNAGAVVKTIKQTIPKRNSVILVDIGGYFATSVNEIAASLGERLLGVMEGTENGVQKYEQYANNSGASFAVPVVTVARSPLKLPEDYHVGTGVVFSVEAVLREQSQILQTRRACVVGYGRVGRSVAEVLRGRGIPTVVHDRSPIAMAEAAARGFQVFRRLDDALQFSNLVVSATGGHAIDRWALASFRTGTVVATVTSVDDEFVESDLELYRKSRVSASIARYESGARYFWLVNDGNPANFVHGAVIGPAMQLIEGEKMAALVSLYERSFVLRGKSPIAEVPDESRATVAEIWNEHFLED